MYNEKLLNQTGRLIVLAVASSIALLCAPNIVNADSMSATKQVAVEEVSVSESKGNCESFFEQCLIDIGNQLAERKERLSRSQAEITLLSETEIKNVWNASLNGKEVQIFLTKEDASYKPGAKLILECDKTKCETTYDERPTVYVDTDILQEYFEQSGYQVDKHVLPSIIRVEQSGPEIVMEEDLLKDEEPEIEEEFEEPDF